MSNYVVYEETDHSAPSYAVSGGTFSKSALRKAVAMAKELHRQGRRQPAIYGKSSGGWVGYIQPNGRYRSVHYHGKLKG